MSNQMPFLPPRVSLPTESGLSEVNIDSTQPSPTQTQSGSKKGSQTRWSSRMDDVMIAAMLENIASRPNRVQNKCKADIHKLVATEVNNSLKMNVNGENVRARIKTLRKEYFIAKHALESSGFNIQWDADHKRLTADPDAWDRYIEAHPKAKCLKNKFFPHYDDIAIIVGEENATGDGNITGQDPDAVNDIPRTINLEDDENENEPNVVEGELPAHVENDSHATQRPTASATSSRKPTPPVGSRKRRRSVDDDDRGALSRMSDSIQVLANAIKGPSYESIAPAVHAIPGITRELELKSVMLLTKNPNLISVFLTLDDGLKLPWLEAQFIDNPGA